MQQAAQKSGRSGAAKSGHCEPPRLSPPAASPSGAVVHRFSGIRVAPSSAALSPEEGWEQVRREPMMSIGPSLNPSFNPYKKPRPEDLMSLDPTKIPGAVMSSPSPNYSFPSAYTASASYTSGTQGGHGGGSSYWDDLMTWENAKNVGDAALDFVPIFGSGRQLYRDYQDGAGYGKWAMDMGFFGLDMFGAGSLAKGAAKFGERALGQFAPSAIDLVTHSEQVAALGAKAADFTGKITEEVSAVAKSGFRGFGGEAQMAGRWSAVDAEAEALLRNEPDKFRNLYAMPDNNALTAGRNFEVPAGVKTYTGVAAPQGGGINFSNYLPGGGQQMFVKNFNPYWFADKTLAEHITMIPGAMQYSLKEYDLTNGSLALGAGLFQDPLNAMMSQWDSGSDTEASKSKGW